MSTIDKRFFSVCSARWWGSWVVVASLVLSACAEKSPSMPTEPLKTGYVQPLVADVPLFFKFSATTAARQSVDIVARTRGFVDEVTFTDGQVVEKGDLLYRLETVVNQAVYDQAVAAVDKATAEVAESHIEFKRYQNLVRLGSASEDTLDTARLNYKTALGDLDKAKASLVKARQDLIYTEVRAPITGQMGRTFFYPGALVGKDDTEADTVLTSIAQLDPLYVYFNVPAKHLLTILQAQQAAEYLPLEFRTQGRVRRSFLGRLDFIDKSADPSLGTIEMRGVIANPEIQLYPGQVGKLRLQYAQLNQQLLLPSGCLLLDGAGSYVWVLDKENRLQRQAIERFESIGAWSRVSGLPANSRVLAARLNTLYEGDKVKPHLLKVKPPEIPTLIEKNKKQGGGNS